MPGGRGSAGGGSTGADRGVAVTRPEAAPAPSPFTARSWKLYSVPLARPVTLCSIVVAPLPAMSVQPGSQVAPPSVLRRCCHLVTGEPLSGPAVHARTAWPSPALAVTPVGADGTTDVPSPSAMVPVAVASASLMRDGLGLDRVRVSVSPPSSWVSTSTGTGTVFAVSFAWKVSVPEVDV